MLLFFSGLGYKTQSYCVLLNNKEKDVSVCFEESLQDCGKLKIKSYTPDLEATQTASQTCRRRRHNKYKAAKSVDSVRPLVALAANISRLVSSLSATAVPSAGQGVKIRGQGEANQPDRLLAFRGETNKMLM